MSSDLSSSSASITQDVDLSASSSEPSTSESTSSLTPIPTGSSTGNTSVKFSSDVDPLVQTVENTLDTVNWDALSEISHKLLQVESSHWGMPMHTSGGYDLVRFLHLHDTHNTTLVVRVPLRHLDCDNMNAEFHSIKSEVATMQYLESRTTIPVPHVFHHSAETEGEVRSPYICTFSCPKSKVFRCSRSGATWMTTSVGSSFVRLSTSSFPVLHLISNSCPIYLFQQIVGNPLTFSELYPLLFVYVFGVSDPDLNGDEFN